MLNFKGDEKMLETDYKETSNIETSPGGGSIKRLH
jgi:hypothetical protein